MASKTLFYCFFILFQLSNILPLPAQHQVSSTFGKVLTPKGDLRILIIYAGFENDQNQPYHNWGFGEAIPFHHPTELFYTDFKDFETFKDDTVNLNISKFYREISNKAEPFRIIADVYPKRININPANTTSFGDCNRLVIDKIQKENPAFNWSIYDQRTNFPHYKFDNSVSAPDHKPDYVIIAYRYAADWKVQPNPNMKYWAANYSRLDGLQSTNFNGYTFDGAGFTLAGFSGNLGLLKELFVHELAHELFSCPHYSGANGAIGKYFFTPAIGWDMMNHNAGNTANAFERWVLGWNEIKYDIKETGENNTYELDDFATTGEAIRIKIPHTASQYLWIENHQRYSILDHTPWRGGFTDSPKGSKGIADKDVGIYMYIEDVLENRSAINENMVYDLRKVNGIMPLNAGGNYDYLKPTQYTQSPDELWNNKLYWFERFNQNSISGINPFMNYRNDLDNSGAINNIAGPFGEFNGMADTESFSIIKEILNGSPKLIFSNMGGRNNDAIPFRRNNAFQVGDVIDKNNNPLILNRPLYLIDQDKLTPFYLNGISIKVSGFNKGKYHLKINFKNTELSKNVRWCGDIVVKSVSFKNTKSDLLIKGKATLTLELSGTPNKLEAPFINATVLTIDSGSVVKIQNMSGISLISGSKLLIKKGGKLILNRNAFLKIDSSSVIKIEEGGNVIVNTASKIYINDLKNLEMSTILKKKLNTNIKFNKKQN